MSRPSRAAVVGLGYVGAPLALRLARTGFEVIGIDKDVDYIAQLNGGSYEALRVDASSEDRQFAAAINFTNDFSRVYEASTTVICVPTPLGIDSLPDLSFVLSAAKGVAPHLSPGALLILESTTYPGTTEELLRPILESEGRVIGVDVFLAYSPERINPGDTEYKIQNTPRLVAGSTSACSERVREFYNSICEEVVPVSGIREAETAKLLENTFRQVNIALANEFAQVCYKLKIDYWEVLRAAQTKPYGFLGFSPGPGVGGHCIPVDPIYLSDFVKRRTGEEFRIIELSQKINNEMPIFVGSRIVGILKEFSTTQPKQKVLLLGATYKPDVADVRGSPFLELAKFLQQQKVEFDFHDPYFKSVPLEGQEIEGVDDLAEAISNSSLVVLLQAHQEYLEFSFEPVLDKVFDTRNTIRGARFRL